MEAVFETLYGSIMSRLQEKVPELKFIDMECGQLEGFTAGYRPAVAFPCSLIDFDEFTWEDASNGTQNGNGFVVVRLGFPPFTPSSNNATANQRAQALRYFGIERKIFEALHGFRGSGFEKLLRRTSDTEKRNDDIRVRIIRFATTVKDTSAAPQKTSIARPEPVIVGDMEGN